MRKLILTLTLTAALALALAAPAMAMFGTDWVANEDLAVKFQREVAHGDYQVVKTDELKGWLDAKKPMLIVDTMPYEASYKKAHIPGAVCFVFPVKEVKTLDADTKAKFIKLLGPDKNRLLVFYCGFTKCGRSHNGAMWAVKLGYKNVYRCPGGIKAWEQRDYPTAEAK